MPKIIVGYEGNPNHGNALNWGTAALVINGSLISSCMPSARNQNDPEQELQKFVKEGVVIATEIQIPLDDNLDVYGFFVLDMAKELAEREPYNRPGEVSIVHGIEAFAIGGTRAYYVFRSYKLCRRWLVHLLASKFMLVPWESK